MDPKELKKLLEKLKKDQEALKKGQEILAESQGALKKDLETLAGDRKELESEKERLEPLSVIEPVEEEKFNPKYLKDLVFRGRKEGKPKDRPGKKTKLKTFVPFERPMAVEDVLSFRVNGNEVVFVTADGRKRTAKK